MEKLFKYKEEEKKRIQAEEEKKEEEPWTNFHGMAPPPSQSRSSRTSRNFQGYQPEVETPDLTMHEVMKYFLRMSGLPWFDGKFKNYPAFKKDWRS